MVMLLGCAPLMSQASPDEAQDPGPAAAPVADPPALVMAAQVIAGAGVHQTLGVCLGIPVLEMVAVPVLALAEAAAVVWTGDRLGDGRAAMTGPFVTSLLLGVVAQTALGVGLVFSVAAVGSTLVTQAPGVAANLPLLVAVSAWYNPLL